MDTFLEQSRTFMRAITESFHLVNTSRAGVDLLAEQIIRITKAGLDDRVIEALYPMPQGTTGQNLRAHTLRPQADKDRDLAEMWLFSVFARYESWAESLELEYGIARANRGCQFPFQSNGQPGFVEVFSPLVPDPVMTAIYADSVKDDRLWLPSDTEVRAALLVYRYYKEIRNSLVHSDSRTNQRLATASKEAQGGIATLTAGTQIRSGIVPVLAIGDPITVDFDVVRATIGLLRGLVFSIDARILLSSIGMSEFLARWKQVHGAVTLKVTSKKLSRAPWFDVNISTNLAMPSPTNVKQRGSNRGSWPAASRDALIQYATANWMLRKLL